MNDALLFNPTNDELIMLIRAQRASKFFLLCDTNTRRLCLPLLQDVLSSFETHVIEIKSGEAHKNFETLQSVLTDLINANAGKDALLLNLGGGVVTDLGGFAASVYKRGIKHINVPTTLLAQADAATGGKNGINFDNIKNSVGTIFSPVTVVVNTNYLDTLSDDEWLNGFAEMVKHALLEGGEYWKKILNRHKSQDLRHKIVRGDELAEILKMSIAFKQRIVAIDPTEKGLRKILNFGHTVGHAVEAVTLQRTQPVKHGFAVAFGMKVAMRLSEKYFHADHRFDDACRLIDDVFPKIALTASEQTELMNALRHDKKNMHDEPRFVLLKDIGKPCYDCVVSPLDVAAAIDECLNGGA